MVFVREGGLLAGAIKHLAPGDQEQLTAELTGAEAVTTSEIEGEILDRASVQSSIRRELGLVADKRRVRPAERGIENEPRPVNTLVPKFRNAEIGEEDPIGLEVIMKKPA